MAALGVAVAALGQVVIMSERAFDWPVLTPLANTIFDMHLWPTAVLLGVLLLAAGGALFAASIPSEPQVADLEGPRPGLRALWDGALRWWWLSGLVALGLAISASFWLPLAFGEYKDSYPWLWVTGIAVVAAAFLYYDWLRGVDLGLRIGLLEGGFLIIVTGTFIALNLSDLTSWYYTVIGDEYIYWEQAREVVEGSSPNFFSLKGVYGVLPVAETYYEAAVMKLSGSDYFGWKFAGVLTGAAVFAPLYFLVRGLFSVRTAAAALVLLVAAHVMLAYAHTGYDALFSLAPPVLACALFFSGIRRGSALLVFGAGAAAGLGLYVFYPARVILPVLLALLFLYRSRVDFTRHLAILLFGFALVVAPLVIVNNTDLLTLAGKHSVFNYDPAIVPDPWDRIKDNVLRSPLAFNYNEKDQHFISGSLLEPITAVLAVLGLAYALRRFRRPAFAFLLIWYGIAMAASGIASPHGYVPMIRMSYLIPIMVVFAAIALDRGIGLARGFIGSRPLRTVATALALAVVVLAAVASNLYRFWEVTPGDVRNSSGAVVMRAVLSRECGDGGGNRVILAPRSIGGSLGLAIAARDWGGGTPPVILFHDEMDKVQEFSPASCLVYLPEGGDFLGDAIILPDEDRLRLARLTGGQEPIAIYDDARQQAVFVVK